MCGRVACALDPKSLCCRSASNATGGRIAPVDWVVLNKGIHSGASFPSCNMAPTTHIPVICCAQQLRKAGFDLDSNNCKSENAQLDLVATTMYWTFIPRYFHDELKSFKLSTVNCRSESILEKPMFSTSMRKGYRCVIVCDGYYEWQKQPSGGKQPFIIYNPQKVNWWDSEQQSAEEHNPLLMAGIYDVNESVNKPNLFASVAVVTVDSSTTPNGAIHDRMPAVFEDVEDALSWLDPATPVDDAARLLKPCSNLTFHMVSKSVNAVQHKGLDLCKPLSAASPEKKAKGFLDSWLIKKTPSPVKRHSDASSSSPIPAKYVKGEQL